MSTDKDIAIFRSKFGPFDKKVVKTPVYWLSALGDTDDFGDRYKGVMIDGKTKMGPWANMTEKSWRIHGIGRLGTGFGQKYKKQADGTWLKVKG